MKLIVMIVADDYNSEIDEPITGKEFTLDYFDKVDPRYFTWLVASEIVEPARKIGDRN